MPERSAFLSLPPTTQTITRSEIWLDDGSIVLEVDKVQFRVHRSVLSNHSSVFKGMFTLPSQPPDETMVEGCCVVRLDDQSRDWEALLRYIYYGPQYFRSRYDYPIEVLIASLRLGRKYEFEEFFSRAMGYLKYLFPYTYAFGEPGIDVGWVKNNIFDLVNIAEELGEMELLPVFYYWCLHHHHTLSIFGGWNRSDNTICHLSAESQYTLAIGKEKLVTAIFDKTWAWLASLRDVSPDECLSRNQCSEVRARHLEEALLIFRQSSLLLIPLLHKDKLSQGFCTYCRQYLGGTTLKREEVWKELPSYFGLPEWVYDYRRG
ncbi:hypothetical protein CPB84DRAFT_1869389 [Gymnopilus junonius]|uniref:BTB domain-containing protein n=1 Tax=Gymnopilus junonius TaxID=109634 RepID=A0A9P5NFT7_GYMJU|nr:hypothetical protein CPB84DRAFT_1869389 [Gymnopilus junonius]